MITYENILKYIDILPLSLIKTPSYVVIQGEVPRTSSTSSTANSDHLRFLSSLGFYLNTVIVTVPLLFIILLLHYSILSLFLFLSPSPV